MEKEVCTRDSTIIMNRREEHTDRRMWCTDVGMRESWMWDHHAMDYFTFLKSMGNGKWMRWGDTRGCPGGASGSSLSSFGSTSPEPKFDARAEGQQGR